MIEMQSISERLKGVLNDLEQITNALQPATVQIAANDSARQIIVMMAE